MLYWTYFSADIWDQFDYYIQCQGVKYLPSKWRPSAADDYV